MTQAPTPGPMSASDVKLLVKGDLLRHGGDQIVTFAEHYYAVDYHDRNGAVVARLDGSTYVIKDGGDPWRTAFTFIGRPDESGWMPRSGGENPVPGQRVEVRCRDGIVKRDLSGIFSWSHSSSHDDRHSDIIAFRLAPTAPVEASGSELDERTGYPTHYSHRLQPSGETLGYEIGGVVRRLHDCLDGATKASVSVDTGDLKAALAAVEAQLNSLQRPFDNVVACEASDLRTIISHARPLALGGQHSGGEDAALFPPSGYPSYDAPIDPARAEAQDEGGDQ